MYSYIHWLHEGTIPVPFIHISLLSEFLYQGKPFDKTEAKTKILLAVVRQPVGYCLTAEVWVLKKKKKSVLLKLPDAFILHLHVLILLLFSETLNKLCRSVPPIHNFLCHKSYSGKMYGVTISVFRLVEFSALTVLYICVFMALYSISTAELAFN